LFARTLFGIALLLCLPSLTTRAFPQSHEAVSKEAIDVVLRSPVQLTPIERQKLRGKIREYGWDSADEIVRELYQDKGYFKVEVIPTKTPTLRAKILVLLVNTGKQYHLTRISWRGNAALSQSELTSLIPFETGELFSRTKIAEGLNAVLKLYDSRGYINYICIPTPNTDDDAGTIAFEMDVDEGGQFRFGELDVQGMEEAHRKILLSAWEGLRGRPFNAEDGDKFFNRFFRSPWPHIKPENYTIRKIEESSHTVDYSLQFDPSIRYRVSEDSHLELVESP
jgi:outer membrane translocation and assembly module TamA